MMECSSKNKIITFGSLALNLFLIAFIIGRCYGHHHGFMHNGMMPHRFIEGQGSMNQEGPRGYGMLGHPSALMSQALFSKIEIEANRPFIEERFERMRDVRKELADQLKSGAATPEGIKAHFAEIDGIMKEVKEHMRQKALDKINAMTPEEKSRLADILEK